MKAWSYVMTSDSGKAPNYEAPVVTLAICKPRIRRSARPGELVIGFAGAALGPDPHGTRWAGVVSEVLDFGGYWRHPWFQDKKPGRSLSPDNIYEPIGDTLVQVENDSHGARSVKRDLRSVNVLVFERYWCFGPTAPTVPEEFGLRVSTRGRVGERQRELGLGEWARIEAWLEAQVPHIAHVARRGRGRSGTRC